jgi:glutamate-1-semialdehyde 2,1-aminomutase
MTSTVAAKRHPDVFPSRQPILATYLKRSGESQVAHARATGLMPGGTSRQAGYWAPYPLTFARGQGAHLWDVDGNRYFDLINNYTALAHGHSYPPITEAVQRQAELGTCWVGGNLGQLDLSELIVERVPSVDQVRFTNSGTEAGALAFNIARRVTGRQKLLMARYGYHGSLMEFEVGSFGHEGPITYLAEYNNLADFENVLSEHGSEIAAVFLEPVLGSGGVVTGDPNFLHGVQAAAAKAGALFVLDEVLTLRFSVGAVQGELGLSPDLTMFGKMLGGGLPIGAIGGSKELLTLFDPKDLKLFHTGTFNANPITMAAGLISVNHLTLDRIETMEAGALALKGRLERSAMKVGLPISINRHGSCLNIYFSPRAPQSSIVREDSELIGMFHLAAMNHGLFLAPRGMVALSTVMTDDNVAEISDRAETAMADVAVAAN